MSSFPWPPLPAGTSDEILLPLFAAAPVPAASASAFCDDVLVEENRRIEFVVNMVDKSGVIFVQRNWMARELADQFLQFYLSKNDWGRHWLENYKCYSPRLISFQNDDVVKTQSYSGSTYEAGNWDDYTRWLRDRLVQEFGYPLNSCALNYYRDGNDYIANHSDKEASGLCDVVLAVTFGASRRFDFIHKETREKKRVILHHGDLVLMCGSVQQYYTHGLPKMAGVGPRVSASFRQLQG